MESGILPGIKLCSDLKDIYDRISVNSGVSKLYFNVSKENGLGAEYNGYAPLESWKDASSFELESLFSNSSIKYGFMRLSKIPYYIAEEYFLNLKRFKNYDSGIKMVLLDKHIKKIQNYLCENYLSSCITKFFGIRIIKKLDVPTITYDENANSYIGLHIDCWNNNNYGDSTNYKNRICVNLGTGPRFFYFINLNIKQIKNLIQDDRVFSYEKNDLSAYFLKNHSNYPVIRIILNPGEYYVAPTEEIIHDANFVEEEDITMTFLGNFK